MSGETGFVNSCSSYLTRLGTNPGGLRACSLLPCGRKKLPFLPMMAKRRDRLTSGEEGYNIEAAGRTKTDLSCSNEENTRERLIYFFLTTYARHTLKNIQINFREPKATGASSFLAQMRHRKTLPMASPQRG